MKSLGRVFMILLVLLLLVMPVLGQEATDSGIVPTQEIIPTPSLSAAQSDSTPPPSNGEGNIAPVDLVSDGVQVNLVQVIIGLLGAFAAGGIVGIAGLAVFVDRIRKDTATVAAMESLATSFPPSTKELLERAFTVLEKVGGLGAEVFDAVPIREKVVQIE